jgi:L-lactate dehydrogenase complex protein LldG
MDIPMSSRESILKTLKAARPPFVDVPPVAARRDMNPHVDPPLLARFVGEAHKLSCEVTIHADAEAALDHLLALLGEDRRVLSWDPALIPLPGLQDALARAGIEVAPPDDAAVRVGMTGADGALAATGSVILDSGPGKPRTVSLLPDVHVVVLAANQIAPNLEAWTAARRAQGLEDFRKSSSVLIISGPSRTADIAMQLVLGAHGPAALHVLILE